MSIVNGFWKSIWFEILALLKFVEVLTLKWNQVLIVMWQK